MVLLKKGIRYNLKLIKPDSLPDWLIKDYNGKLPLLSHKGTFFTEPLGIAEYIEQIYPHTSLTRQGIYSYQEVLEKTADFYPTLKEYILNTDENKENSLKQKMSQQLDLIDELIRTTPGKYLCGLEMTLADLYILPQLFHAMVVLERFKVTEIYRASPVDPLRPALENYLNRMLGLEQFNDKKAYYNVDQVVYGWKLAKGELNQ